MKVLLSAYACEPDKGSEPGVGWQWALEIARLGHEVWVLTRANNRANIEKALLNSPPIDNLKFLYYDLPSWSLAQRWKKGERRIHLYYLLWQWGAYLLAKKVHKVEQFDKVHHITFVTIRQPSFMGNLGIPFTFGPVSGGERAPWRLRTGYSIFNWMWEGLKDFSNLLIKVDPLMRRTFKQAERIYVTSHWNLSIVPREYRQKTSVLLPIGFNADELQGLTAKRTSNPETNDNFRILYVGNLLYMKGMHLGIAAFAQLLKKIPFARLTLVGSGPEEQQWKSLAERLGVNDNIEWIPRQDRQKLSEIYSAHDIFLYPTVQDPGGIVMLEALAHGLPVVCLDQQKTGIMVDETCGVSVEINHLNKRQVIRAMSNSLAQLAQDPKRLRQLSEGALLRAQEFCWSKAVSQIYPEILEVQTSLDKPSRRQLV